VSDHPRSHEWPWRSALVTGASAGIGEAMARALAAHGLDRLVVVARRADRLDALAATLHHAHGTKVEVLTADLATDAGIDAVAARIAADDPGFDLVVNNAGLGRQGPLATLHPDHLDAMLSVNVVALTRLTRAALEPMVARNRGAICNVSSLASFQPSPNGALYAATKAFVTSLGESVSIELEATDVSITTVCPGFTRTEFLSAADAGDHHDMAPSFVWMSAESVAVAALDATAAGRALCIPGVGYQAVAAISSPLPRRTKRWLMGKLTGSAAAAAASACRVG
jgi:short-subunit dehydrogenase